MKIHNGFISNSSSSSFYVADEDNSTEEYWTKNKKENLAQAQEDVKFLNKLISGEITKSEEENLSSLLFECLE